MRSFLVTLGVLFMLAVASNGESTFEQKPYKVAVPFVEVMKKHFQNSMDYLFKSKLYDSQYHERPGMAKFLMAASDYEWEQGLEFLKKFMEKDGNLEDYAKALSLDASGEFVDNETPAAKVIGYSKTVETMLVDAETISLSMNRVRDEAMTTNITQQADHEICHFLDEKLEKKSARIYELKNRLTMLNKMHSIGIAVEAFDSSL